MKPVGIVKRDNGENLVVHQCQGCGFVSNNRVAGDDDDKLVEDLLKDGVGDRLV